MKSRVTIKLDSQADARAEQVARARRTTVSGLIEAFLRSTDADVTSVSLVDDMLGSAKLRSVKLGDAPLYDALHARYIARQR